MRYAAIPLLLLAACAAPRRVVDARIEGCTLIVWADTQAEYDNVIDIEVFHEGEIVGGFSGTGGGAFQSSQGVTNYPDDASFDIVVKFISTSGVLTEQRRVTVAKVPGSD